MRRLKFKNVTCPKSYHVQIVWNEGGSFLCLSSLLLPGHTRMSDVCSWTPDLQKERIQGERVHKSRDLAGARMRGQGPFRHYFSQVFVAFNSRAESWSAPTSLWFITRSETRQSETNFVDVRLRWYNLSLTGNTLQSLNGCAVWPRKSTFRSVTTWICEKIC